MGKKMCFRKGKVDDCNPSPPRLDKARLKLKKKHKTEHDEPEVSGQANMNVRHLSADSGAVTRQPANPKEGYTEAEMREARRAEKLATANRQKFEASKNKPKLSFKRKPGA